MIIFFRVADPDFFPVIMDYFHLDSAFTDYRINVSMRIVQVEKSLLKLLSKGYKFNPA